MEFLLDCLSEYCRLNSLALNADKTKVVVFRKGGRSYKRQHFNYDQEKISIQPKYNYLGVEFDLASLFSHTSAKVLVNANVASASTRSLIHRSKTGSSRVIDKLFSSLVSLFFSHACPVWSLPHLADVERIQNLFYKNLYNLPSNTPRYALRIEFDRFHLVGMVFKASIRRLTKVLQMQDTRYSTIALEDLFLLYNSGYPAKYNWLRCSVNTFLIPTDEGDVLPDLGSLPGLLARSDELIQKFNSYTRRTDSIKYENSRSLIFYSSLDKIA